MILKILKVQNYCNMSNLKQLILLFKFFLDFSAVCQKKSFLRHLKCTCTVLLLLLYLKEITINKLDV